MNWRIVTGYYITALGQESERYYFKTTDETIKVGDVGLTFYQNNQFPSPLKVDRFISVEKNDVETQEEEVTVHSRGR